MNVIKGSLIYQPGHRPGGEHWAQCPVIDELDDRLRIYYADRDLDGRAFITYLETEKEPPFKIVHNHLANILKPGKPGTFDEHGQMPSCIKVIDGRKFLYYTGWSGRLGDTHYENQIGVIEVKNSYFKRLFDGPIIGKDRFDSIFTGSLFVTESTNSNLQIGYYLSCKEWKNGEPYYEIKSASSMDGIDWNKEHGNTELHLQPGEGGICSVGLVNRSTMIFCVRGDGDYRNDKNQSYRIEYAKLDRGTWIRLSKVNGLDVSYDDWDSEMVCYPYVYKNYIFYNGNGFGKFGFGYATIQ